MRLVVVLAFDEAHLLDITGPLQVFASAACGARDLGIADQLYDVVVASLHGGLVRTTSGIEVMTCGVNTLADREIDTLLVSGGAGTMAAAKNIEFINWIEKAARKARRVGSVCTGASLLAAAGLLDGRRATTHWDYCDGLARDFPAVAVECDALYVEDRGVWTSAGVTAGIDMALAMIEQDAGGALALRTARQLVLFLKRSGGQPQFSIFLRAQAISDDNLNALAAWILDNPRENLEVEVLAKRAGMSVRSLFRAFNDHLRMTPRDFVEDARLETARRMLEQTRDRVDYIARKSGFSSSEAMRRAFKRRFQVAPGVYRDRFTAGPVQGAIGRSVQIAPIRKSG